MTPVAPPAHPRPPAEAVDVLWAELVAEVRRILHAVEDGEADAAPPPEEDPDDHERH